LAANQALARDFWKDGEERGEEQLEEAMVRGWAISSKP
jgi:hypothetical protein